MRSRFVPPAVLLAAIAAAAACSGGDVPEVPADATILVSSEPLDIRLAAYVGTEQNVSLQVLNRGRAPLTVNALKLTQPDGGALPANSVFTQPQVTVDGGLAPDPLPVVIGGLGTGFVQFTYAPKAPGKSAAQLVVGSNAPARPTVVVPVSGCAVYADAGPDSGC